MTATYYDTAGYKGYVNGLLDGTAGVSSGGLVSNSGILVIGNDIWFSSRNIDGIVDEVRISNIARSADWVKTEFNNQNSPGTFYTIGSEQ